MADIFVSYARTEEAQASRIADALRAAGYAVWRDDELPAHRAYADVIEERLQSAKAVVVLWSAEAAKSQWVRAEADHARGTGRLVQASIDGTVPPLPFNQIQFADLKGWAGEAEAAGWRKLASSVAALAGEGVAPPSCKAGPKPRTGASVCVLPFANMSGDAEQEYFSDGISEDITTDLSKISALAVIARNTAFTFKGQSVNVAEIARKLGVSHVLEGSVRKAGARVRITAQLIDGASGDHVWAERYDRDLDDIFAIQDEISRAIVDALKLKLLPEEKKAIGDRCTCNADAYDLYLMARNYWITGNHGDRRREERVIRLCSRAVEIDPDYAQAWALLSLAQVILRFSYGQSGDDGTAAAKRAIELDPEVAEAHVAMARYHSEHDAFDEGMAAIERALQLDPDSWEANKEAGRLMMRQRRIPEAAAHYRKAVAVMESDYHGWGMLLSCLRAAGDQEESVRVANRTFAEVEKVLAQDSGNGAAISFGVAALAVLGKKDQAREWIDKALLLDPDNLNMRYNFACALAADLGDREGAIALLETTLSRATGTLGVAEADPDLDSIRDDPRFQKLIADRKAELARQARSEANPPATSAPPRS